MLCFKLPNAEAIRLFLGAATAGILQSKAFVSAAAYMPYMLKITLVWHVQHHGSCVPSKIQAEDCVPKSSGHNVSVTSQPAAKRVCKHAL